MPFKKIPTKGTILSGNLKGETAEIILHSESLQLLATESGHHVLLPPNQIKNTDFKRKLIRNIVDEPTET